jgi:hypothetical protein
MVPALAGDKVSGFYASSVQSCVDHTFHIFARFLVNEIG